MQKQPSTSDVLLPVGLGFAFVVALVFITNAYNARPVPPDPLANCSFKAKERTGEQRTRGAKIRTREYETIYTHTCPDGKRLTVKWER